MNNALTLSDGRILSYTEYGNPAGAPLFYCHGFPTSRIEYEAIAGVVDRSGLDVRVIVPDRPGYGMSTFQPGRILLDWPVDVAEAADQLGVAEFAVLGVSGGGPYALACASAMPERVTRLGLIVAAGPADGHGMDESLILRTVPRVGLVRRIQFAMMSVALTRGHDDEVFDRTLSRIADVDRAFLTAADNRDWFLRMIRDALNQGGRAAAHDGGIYLRPWGFDVAGITTKTHLWYGGQDETVPAPVGRWLADQIADSSLVLWPHHGHFTWMPSTQAVEAIAMTSGAGHAH